MASTFPLESSGRVAYMKTDLRNREMWNLILTTHDKKLPKSIST
jgi:hypothetical protein